MFDLFLCAICSRNLVNLTFKCVWILECLFSKLLLVKLQLAVNFS